VRPTYQGATNPNRRYNDMPCTEVQAAMTTTTDEATWRAEFEKLGEESTRDSVRTGCFQEPKRQFAYRWLADRALQRERREALTIRYLRLILLAAVFGIIVGIIGLLATLSQ
jgi:hypothetical protein